MGLLVALTFLILLLVLVVGTGLWLADLEGRHKPEAAALEQRVALALRRSVGEVPVIPIAYLSKSRRTPDVLEVHGPVASLEVREAVLRAAADELSRSHPGCQLSDRLAVAETDRRVVA
jgi:hypothetical protein